MDFSGADAYNSERGETREISCVCERLSPEAVILDVGCGSVVPVDRQLAKHYRVIVVDISDRMIELAKLEVPDAEFIRANILESEFPDNSFDAIVSFYMIFHIPRSEHAGLLRCFYRWIKSGGLFLGSYSEEGYHVLDYTEPDFFGTTIME